MTSEGSLTGFSVLVLSSVPVDEHDWSGFSFFDCLGLTKWISFTVQNVVYKIAIITKPVHLKLLTGPVASSHWHRSDVMAVSCCILTPVITVYKSAAICEHASPAPAIQLQCAHNISPSGLTPTQGLRGDTLIFWLCFTCNIYYSLMLIHGSLIIHYLCCHYHGVVCNFRHKNLIHESSYEICVALTAFISLQCFFCVRTGRI